MSSSSISPNHSQSHGAFTVTMTATPAATSSKGFQVTHTSFPQGTPPLTPASPPLASAAHAGSRTGVSASSAARLPSPLQAEQLPPNATAADGGASVAGRSTSAGRSFHRSSSSSSANSGLAGTPPMAPRTAVVPLITPRYQKKSRTNRHMNISDSFPEQQTPSGALQQAATERMTVQNGPMQYEEEVHFHTYDVYRHGKRQIMTRSVGYSSDGDIVMTREDYSEASDVDNSFVRKRTEISDPTVLDPRARRPLTDTEARRSDQLHLNRPRYKKYPGIRIPKNRRIRNRLLNDHFANEMARSILMKAQAFRQAHPEAAEEAPPPSFTDLPKAVIRAFDLEGEEQLMEFERLHVHPDVVAPQLRNARPLPHPDSPEGRFQGLNTRLRGELQHALNSEFLTEQIEDLEVHFANFIKNGATSPESLVFHFRDGYGRLICHGVAAYYLLVSESHTMMDGSGVKLTYVSLPKTRKHGVRSVSLPQVPLIMLLKRNRRHLPAKHSLSANTTPQMAPATDPGLPPPLGMEAAESRCLAELKECDAMSPLDLGASAMLHQCSPRAPHASALDGTALSANASVSPLLNRTVFLTVDSKLLVDGPLPLYTPVLLLELSAEQQEVVSERLDAGSAATTPNLGPTTPPLTATRRKKVGQVTVERANDNFISIHFIGSRNQCKFA